MRKHGFESSLPLLAESTSGPLTRPEELRRLFDEIDSNKNGCLDKSELQVGPAAVSLLRPILGNAQRGCACNLSALVQQ